MSLSLNIETAPSEDNYKQNETPHTKRWFIQFLIFLLSFTNGMTVSVYSPIQELAISYFKTDLLTVLWQNNVWQLTYVLFSIPAQFSLVSMNIKNSIVLSSFLNAFGAWIRYQASSHIYFSLFGTFLLALPQLWYSPATIQLVDLLHTKNERFMVTSILVFSFNLGISFGYIFAAIYVEFNINLIDSMQKSLAIINTVPFILILLFFNIDKENDDKTEKQELAIPQMTKTEFFEQLLDIYTKPINIFHLSLISSFVGITWTYQTVIQNILEPMGFNVLQLGYFGLYMNIFGTIGGFCSSMILANQQKRGQVPQYDVFIKFFITLQTILCFLLDFLIYYYKSISTLPLYIITSLIGLGQNAFVPIGIQSFMDTVYPSSDSIAINSIFLTSSLPNFVFVFISAKRPYILNYLMLPFYFIMMCCYKTQEQRYQQDFPEKQNRQNKNQDKFDKSKYKYDEITQIQKDADQENNDKQN